MAIATGTALALAAGGSSLAGNLIGAKKKSSAAKKAAAEQQKATDQATGYLREGMGQMRGLYSPYINAGQSVMGTLGRLTTAPPGSRFAAPPPPNATPQMQEPGGQAMPRPASQRGMPPPQGGGRMVQLRAPDGSVQAVPSHLAQSYIAKGAQIVQGENVQGGGAPGGGGRPQGPYMMAEGGDMVVNKPTMFVAGEAGPERATFQPMGGGNKGSDIGAGMRRPAGAGGDGGWGGAPGPALGGLFSGMGGGSSHPGKMGLAAMPQGHAWGAPMQERGQYMPPQGGFSWGNFAGYGGMGGPPAGGGGNLRNPQPQGGNLWNRADAPAAGGGGNLADYFQAGNQFGGYLQGGGYVPPQEPMPQWAPPPEQQQWAPPPQEQQYGEEAPEEEMGMEERRARGY